jgi:hypothetical protein
MIQEGWPSTRKECPTNILTYWNVQHELSFTKGILLKGDRLIIPKNLQLATLQQLHAAHLGTEKTKQQARMLVYWPGLSADIKQYIAKCQTCAKPMSNSLKELMINHSIETLPWQKIATDLFEWNGSSFLATVDYHSRFLEVDRLTKTSSNAVIM